MVMCGKCRCRKNCAKRFSMKDGDDCQYFVRLQGKVRLPKSHKCSWPTDEGNVVVTSYREDGTSSVRMKSA